jgi:fibronectin-binding autotransporter adhesin
MRTYWALFSLTTLLAGPAASQPITWDGDAGDGLWISEMNWDPDTVPGSSNDVMIPGDAGQVTIILSSEICATLSCLSSLRLSAGSIEVLGNSNVSNMVFEDGFGPTVTTGGAFTISGSSTCELGIANGSGSFVNAGSFDAMIFYFEDIAGSNTGTWTIDTPGGFLDVGGTSVLTNSGTMSLMNDTTISGSGLLMNSGTISRTGGQGFASIGSRLNMTGGQIIASGMGANLSLDSDGWGISDGSITVSDGAVIDIVGSNMSQTRSMGASMITGNGSINIFPQNSTIDWPGQTLTSVADGGLTIRTGTINLSGSISNNALMELRGTTLSGTGSFSNLNGSILTIPASNASELSLNSANIGTIKNRGLLYISSGAQLTNTGLLETFPDTSIDTFTPMMPGSIQNNGTIRFSGSSLLEPPAVVRVQTHHAPGSAIDVRNGTLAFRGGGTFSGSSIGFDATERASSFRFEGDPGTMFSFTGSLSLNGISGSDQGRVDAGSFGFSGPTMKLNAGATITNHGRFDLLGAEFEGLGTIRNEQETRWFAGTLGCTLQNTGSSAELLIGAGIAQVLTGQINNTNGASVRQAWAIGVDDEASIVNESTWRVVNGSSISYQGTGGKFFNQPSGSFLVDDPTQSFTIVDIEFDNKGTVTIQQGNAAFTRKVTQLNETTGALTGGQWIVGTNATLSFPRTLAQVSGPAFIDADTGRCPDLATLGQMDLGAIVELGDSFINNSLMASDASTLNVKGDVFVSGDYSSSGGSETNIEAGGSLQTTGMTQIGEVDSAADDISTTVVIALNGAPQPSIITSQLELFGGFRVGETGDSTVLMDGDLLMRPNARMHIKLIPGSSDTLLIEGNATLAGDLMIDASEASFIAGQTFTVLNASGGIDGGIDDVVVDGLASGQTYSAGIVGNELRITATSTCPGDLNGDGDLDFFDVSAFLSAYNAQDPIADFTMDGMFNFFDVSAFLSAFSAGCP